MSDRAKPASRIPKVLAWSIWLLALAVSGGYLAWHPSEHRAAIFQARKQAPIDCPAGTSLNTRPWRKMETIRYCEPDINGKVQIWADAFLEAEGEFRNGKEHGRWILYEPISKRKRIVVYDNGRLVSEERTEQ